MNAKIGSKTGDYCNFSAHFDPIIAKNSLILTRFNFVHHGYTTRNTALSTLQSIIF